MPKKTKPQMSKAFKKGDVDALFRSVDRRAEEIALPYGPLPHNESTELLEKIVTTILSEPDKVIIKRKPKDIPTHIEVTLDGVKYNLTQMLKEADLRTIDIEEATKEHYVNFVKKKAKHGGSAQKAIFEDDDQLNLMGLAGKDEVTNPTEEQIRKLDTKHDFDDLHYAELMALNIYTQGYYSVLNGILRGRLNPFEADVDTASYDSQMKEALCHIALANSGLNKVPEVPLPAGTRAFRYDDKNLPKTVLDQRKESADRVPGKPLVVRESGFVSTSLEKPSEDFDAEYRTVFTNVTGRNVGAISFYPGERELLMPPTDIVYVAHFKKHHKHYFLAKPVRALRDTPEEKTQEEKEFDTWLSKQSAAEESAITQLKSELETTSESQKELFKEKTTLMEETGDHTLALLDLIENLHRMLSEHIKPDSLSAETKIYNQIIGKKAYYKAAPHEFANLVRLAQNYQDDIKKIKIPTKLSKQQEFIDCLSQMQNHLEQGKKLAETLDNIESREALLQAQRDSLRKQIEKTPTAQPRPYAHAPRRGTPVVRTRAIYRAQGGALPTVGKPYYMLDGTAKHIEFVYQKFLSKPYNRDLKKFDDNDWNLKVEGKGKIERPNHGLAHTLRVTALVPLVHEFLKAYSPQKENFEALDAKTLKRCQYIALFKVIGRENELGFKDAQTLYEEGATDVNLYSKFKDNSRKALVDYTLHHHDKDIDFRSKKELEQWHEYLDSGNPNLPGEIAKILRIAHNLDLMRCYDHRQFKHTIKSLKEDLGGNEEAATRLLEYVRGLMDATGNRVMGFGEDQDYNDDLFYDCSTDYKTCLAQINSVPKPAVRLSPRPEA
ncbi:MAG: hypothetical protein JSR17_00035 [Proteobacteria bacterium]|nr:hypothetical protein [Pseudomonadota bacterium]